MHSVEELLKDTSIRLVVVATPNATHLPIARQCLLADRDVVIDKPFAVTSAEAAELIQLARSRKRLLSVYQNRRWDGDFLTVRKLLDSDRLGRLVKFESHYDRFRQLPRLHAWREDGRPGGGVLFDLGAHLVDQALVLFGVPAIGLGKCACGTGRAAGLMTPSICTCTILRRTPRRPPPFPDRAFGSRRMAARHLPGTRARSPLHPQRHPRHLSQIRHRLPGSPSARRRYVFLQALGSGGSGTLGHPHPR